MVLALSALAGCGKDAPAPASSTPASSATAPAPRAPVDTLMVAAPSALQQRLRVATVERRLVNEPLSVVGRIDFDEYSVSRIGSSVTGRITELGAAPGQAVVAGQVLAQLNSAELGTAQLTYLKADAQRELAAKAVERARLLLAADVIGTAELQRRENELKVAEIEQRAAADQLRVMGMSPAAVSRTLVSGAITSNSSVVSTVSGVVVERKVNRGQVVQPADELFTVADLSRVWVIAKVPESQITRVQIGQTVKISVTSSPVPLRGRVAWIADTVSVETRTVTVRTEVDNPKRQLRPAMLADVTIEPAPIERLVVPGSAVVRESNRDHVFVRQADGRYRLTALELADETGEQRIVESGLKGGDEIVVEGAFHLNNERKRAELEGS
jgi:cobalt-zinc-cadmium efflux system membrane fusion protein